MLNLKSKLEQIPNSVSGDGRNFVAQLKQFLKGFRDDTEEKIDSIGAGAVEQVFGLQLTEEHSYDSNGNPINNIFVEFDNTNVSDYLNAQIWMKKSTENVYQMVGTTSNVTYTITGVVTGVTYCVKVIACNTNAGTSDFDTAPVEEITIRGNVYVPAAPTQFYLTWDSQGALWEWDYIDNGYVDYFELRLDGYAGVANSNRLDRTENTYSRVAPTVNSGTAYLFIRNVYGMYSLPATHTFNIVAPRKPAAPTLDIGLDGVVITMEALPSGCYGYVLEITDFENHTETFETSNSQFTFFQFSGSISVKYAFKAVTGDGHGEWSDTVSGNVSGQHVESGRIVDGAITTDKIASNAVTAAKISANTITSDKLYVGATEANKIKTVHLYAGTTETDRIQANNIAAGAIITDKLAANAVTSAKIYAGNVDALRIQAENIAAGAIKTNQLDAQAVTAAKIYSGTTESDKIQANNIAAGAITTAKLDAQAVTAAKIYSGTTESDKIQANNIAAGVITADKLYAGNVESNRIQANNIAASAITTAKLDAQAVTAAKIYSGTTQSDLIQANNIATGVITADKLYAGNVESNRIQANNIAASAITTDKIAAGAVTANKISVNSLSAINATLGTFQSAAQGQPRVVISDSLIEVYDGNTLRVRLGVWN